MPRFLLCIFVLLSVLTLRVNARDARWVDSTLASLSLEERVGQLFVVELVPLFTNEKDPAFQYALEMIRRYHVGAFILGGGTPLEIAVITNRLQGESRVPLLINGDLEAGMTYAHPWRVARGWGDRLPAYVSGGGTQFPSQMAIGATGNPRYAYELGQITGREARAVGIHWSNSPVADVNNNPDNPIINTRSYGEDPAMVAAMVAAYVKGAESAGMIATVKHFPGHGDTREDTHMKLPSLPFDMNRLDSVELVPFRAGIEAGVHAVMTAHLALPKIDSSGRPATLSPPILTGILRDRLGFNGIIVTDGMRMQGITDRYSPGEAAVRAIEAGADVVLGSEDIDAAIHGLLAAVRSGRITQQRLEASVKRVLAAKAWVGLSRQRTVSIDSIFSVVASPEAERIAEEISDASVTLFKNDKQLLPLRSSAHLRIITVSDEPSTEHGVDLLGGVLPFVPSATLEHVSNETGSERFNDIKGSLRKDNVVLVGIYLSVVAWKGEQHFARPLEEFLTSLGTLPCPVILVAFGDPYVLGKLPETAAVLTPFNGTVIAERSVAKAITGRMSIRGRTPVTIPGRYKRGEGMVGN